MDEHEQSAYGRYIIENDVLLLSEGGKTLLSDFLGGCRIEPVFLMDDDTVPGVLYSEYSRRVLRQQANNNTTGEDGRRIAIALVDIRGSAICQMLVKKYHEEF